MNTLFFLLLKRLRLPLILLISAYAIVIIGFVLIPGQDDQGNVWYMSFFHAFYFVSFMGSTIGFGEIPYEFTNAQRMWTVFSIYISVTVWLYSIGAVLSTLQNPAFKKILKENEFKKRIKGIKDPFYLICGYGDTGKVLAHELSQHNILSVVVDIDPERVDNLQIDEPNMGIPALAANASFPKVLETAGLTHKSCKGIIALTNKDEVNLKIAITARLLSKKRIIEDKDLMIICKAQSNESEANMSSFGTSHIINPFELYAKRLALSVRSPSAYLIYEWLTNPYHNVRDEPIVPPKGTWVICGYGRFGKAIARHLSYVGIKTIIIEALPEKTQSPEGSIKGRGTEAITLREAKITEAVAIVAGTDNDANNLSIIITAQDEMRRTNHAYNRNKEYRELYNFKTINSSSEKNLLLPDQQLFTIARQNYSRNKKVFEEAELDFIMQPAGIIAGEILSIIKTPLLKNFLLLARRQKDEWANLLISRISNFIEYDVPTTWMIEISKNHSPAIMPYIKKGDTCIEDLLRSPRNRDNLLNCIVLLVHRKIERGSRTVYNKSSDTYIINNTHKSRKFNDHLLPDNQFLLQENDQLLICGDKESMNLMQWTVSNVNVYNYIHTGSELPGGYFWQWLYNKKQRQMEMRNEKKL
ncbi:MAG: potassium channel family protein [gamma proteobacterium symbiont of Taylorina sp.]|nr:potassium channel family protein [gamma proteobacterium symbiont of Taylorina sp.]